MSGCFHNNCRVDTEQVTSEPGRLDRRKNSNPSLVLGLAATSAAVLDTTGTASDKHQDGRNQRQRRSSQNAPDGRSPVGLDVGRAPGVDGVLDDLEAGKVAGHGDDGGDKGQEGEEGRDKGAEEAGAQAEEEGQEGEAGGDGVQDHDLCENPEAIAVGL